MRNRFKFNILLILLISLGACTKASDEAINAGFKSDIDYQNHLEELRVKRDSSFKENILYATNLSAFNDDNQYEAAIVNLIKNSRKYISQNGSNYKLLHASTLIIDLNQDEYNNYKKNQYDSLEEKYACIEEAGEDPSTNYEVGSASYEIVKASWDIKMLLCNLGSNADGISQIFFSSHTAARKLVNSRTQVNSKEDAEILFNKLLLNILNENK